MKTVYVHAGHLSLDNGAVKPAKLVLDLRDATDSDFITGQYWGDDRLMVSDERWPLVEALLIESKLLYRVHLEHDCWQNVQSEELLKRFGQHSALAA